MRSPALEGGHLVEAAVGSRGSALPGGSGMGLVPILVVVAILVTPITPPSPTNSCSWWPAMGDPIDCEYALAALCLTSRQFRPSPSPSSTA